MNAHTCERGQQWTNNAVNDDVNNAENNAANNAANDAVNDAVNNAANIAANNASNIAFCALAVAAPCPLVHTSHMHTALLITPVLTVFAPQS